MKKSKHLSPKREEPCKSLNEPKSKTQDWARKLVGSIRRKVSTKKSNSNAADLNNQNEEFGEGISVQAVSSCDSQEIKVETVKKVFTDLEELELSPKIDSRVRKMSLTGSKQLGNFERKYSQKSLHYQRTITYETETIEHRYRSSTNPVNFEKCKIRRKMSFPSANESFTKCDGKLAKKKDATLLALIFKKQSSFDVKKDGKEPAADAKSKEKPRKIPDFSFSNSASPDPSVREGIQSDFKCGFESGSSLTEPKTAFYSGRVGSTPKTMSRSCGQVETLTYDPAVRENFLRATMSIFLAVSPPSSRIQVNRCLLSVCSFFFSMPFCYRFKNLYAPLGMTQNRFAVAQRNKRELSFFRVRRVAFVFMPFISNFSSPLPLILLVLLIPTSIISRLEFFFFFYFYFASNKLISFS